MRVVGARALPSCACRCQEDASLSRKQNYACIHLALRSIHLFICERSWRLTFEAWCDQR